MNNLENAIIETIVYFDIFEYPLRVNEIQRWLWKSKASLNEIISLLETSSFLKEKLSFKDGFFFLSLKGKDSSLLEGKRKDIIIERLKRYRIAEEKYRKARKIIQFLSKIPFVRGIAICNDLGYSNSPEEGDIDLFIITSKNRIWFVRQKIAGFLKIFRLRPGEAKENAICPSFFIDEDNLNLKNLSAIVPFEDDIHFIYWLCQMTPVFGRDKIWQRFYNENKWAFDLLPNNYPFIPNPVRRVKANVFQNIFESLLSGFVGDLVEKFCRYVQLKILPKEIKLVMNKDNNVVIRNGVLKLHTNDRRREYYDEFYFRISNI